MPAKNAIKQFAPETMYHAYNRGVDKRIIFCDEQDYAVFLSFLKFALSPDDDDSRFEEVSNISQATRYNLRRLKLHSELELVSFCLMPNHFHLLLYQHTQDAITRLMRSIATAYSIYFNKRYERSGTLFQGRYKASAILNDTYGVHISRYIHLNPIELGLDYRSYSKSSYRMYMGEAETVWLKPQRALDYFLDIEDYSKFVAEYIPRRAELKALEKELGVSN